MSNGDQSPRTPIPAELDVLETCINVRCLACQRSLVAVNCGDDTCMKRADCGLRPILDLKTTIRALREPAPKSETSTPASGGDPAKALRSVMLFPNFNIAAFDRQGKQVAEIQENLLLLWASLAAHDGYDPTSTVIETPLYNWRIFKTAEGGYNLERA